MGGVGQIFTPPLVRRPLGPLGLSGPMTSTSLTHAYLLQTVLLEGITLLLLPICSLHPPYPLLPTLSYMQSVILQ